ncbi:tRNA/rRNA methyltransferase SpoU [Penicillium verhagenii]|uniref:tRNA/rRNA methyltransferase SpoU n=1 Tax=Penicillium verhagenii TaxID=1562060 RepID=UPI00254593B2|nr:tRNA/rRNA methyltransferase SpoU [Penicillium verhagenii]KAJ5923803.1 tRNA/rRNA methyltransferase SpoU [Penicillium verhagenii]
MLRFIIRPAASSRVLLTTQNCSLTTIRQASLNSAIGRGIRRSGPRPSFPRDSEDGDRRPRAHRDGGRNDSHFPPRYPRRDDTMQERRPSRESRFRSNGSDEQRQTPRRFPRRDDKQEHTFKENRFRSNDSNERQAPRGYPRREDRQERSLSEKRSGSPAFDQKEFIRSGNFQALPREHQASETSRWNQDMPSPRPRRGNPKSSIRPRSEWVSETMPERVKDNVKVPDSIPYTTPASEFIYGTSAVEAALRCGRRQLYKLYLYQAAEEELSPAKAALRKLALTKNVNTKLAFAGWDRLMDKMSAGRPHNGCILEASPLPKLPVRGLHAVPTTTETHFRVELAPQTREEAVVNGTNDCLPVVQSPVSQEGVKSHRFPVALLLDGVVDPGNMGAIIRSAYYLGIDAIIFAGRNSAPLSPVTIKASAGAAENMSLLQVKNEVDFMQRSQANGWRFYAADAPGPGATYLDRAGTDGDSNSGLLATQAPSVLMMGSEGSGLSGHIKSHADAIVSIPGARHSVEMGVKSDPARIDSLNVSVAAAILMEMFLRTPLALSGGPKKSKDKMW